MTFRELFDRYQAGAATEEERRLVDEELEKATLINEHLFGTWEEPPAPAPQAEYRQVRRSLRRRNTLLVLTSLVLAAALFLGVTQIAMPMAEKQYFDPTRATWSEDFTDFEILMNCYQNLFSPESLFFGVETVRDTGFASWELELCYSDRHTFDHCSYRTATVEKNDIRFPRGTLYFASPSWFQNMRFINTLDPENRSEFADFFLQDLDDRDGIVAVISFARDLNAQELMKLNEELGFGITWAAVRTYSQYLTDGPLIGVRLNEGRNDNGVNADYPELCSIPDARNLEEHFRSLVSYCRDYERGTMDIGMVEDPDFYDRVLDYVDEKGLGFYGAYVYLDPAELRTLIESDLLRDVKLIRIDPVHVYLYGDVPSFGG